MRRRFILVAGALPVLSAAACSDATAPRTPAALESIAGDAQTAVAGTAVAVRPAVRVLDGSGRPLEGVRVRFVVDAGGGEVTGGSPTTGADGVASPGAWVLGTTAGANVLVAQLDGLAPVRFEADAVAGEAATLAAHAGIGQSGAVGAALGTPVSVRAADAYDNPVAGVVVAFAVIAGSGAIEAAAATTGVDGIASAGTWTLGAAAGTQRLRATATGLAPLEVTAMAIAGPPAGVQAYSGQNQVGTVGTQVAVAPAVRVRDAHGNIVAGATVRFRVADGAGSVGPSAASQEWVAVSTAAGVASSGGWVLGTRSGPQTLIAELPGGAAVVFSAIAQAGPAVAVRVHTGDGQTGSAGAFLAVPPAVFVADQYGNPVPGATVTFSPSSDGSVLPPMVQTGLSGTAWTSWRLGPATGAQQLEARLGALAPVVFTATATLDGGDDGEQPGYQIEVRFTTPVPASQQAVFEQAAARWALAITGDLPAAEVIADAETCGTPHPPLSDLVDDLLVLVTIEPIDGVGKVLGSAGPCFVRSAGGQTVVGVMRLDEADIAHMEANGNLRDVIVHEVGHILGIGTLWGGLLVGRGTDDPYFTGPAALAGFDAVGGSSYAGNPVPVENTGGLGTRNGHWRESVFANELMTGWINAGTNPLSRVTIASLEDIGYVIDVGAADAFAIGAGEPPQGVLWPPILLEELPLPVAPIPIPTRR